MWVTVTGGSGSGKSKLAEEIIQYLCPDEKVYLATLQFIDGEMEERIKKHLAMREGKHFVTVEAGQDLQEVVLPEAALDGILLECMSNLLANEMYGETAKQKAAPVAAIADYVLEEVKSLRNRTKHLVVVTNEVFSEMPSCAETDRYVDIFGRINRGLAEASDVFIEAVYGLPVYLKGKRENLFSR